MIKRTERGWAGHFICAHSCLFKRNTLLEKEDYKVVVSTVGMYVREGNVETIGAGGRYYETMVFEALKEGPYFDADVSLEVSFKSEWAICADNVSELPEGVDNLADQMHEAVVAELITTMSQE